MRQREKDMEDRGGDTMTKRDTEETETTFSMEDRGGGHHDKERH